MKCMECPHFHIMYGPIRVERCTCDTGLAKCEKYDLVVDFLSERKLNRLTCVDEMEKKNGRSGSMGNDSKA